VNLVEPAEILRPLATGRYVIWCDHASNHIPAELHDLGLPQSELQRHIAWDLGAVGVTRALSELLNAPAILCNTSRLVIDCNRQLHARDLIPEISDGTLIPGNRTLTPLVKSARIDRWFHPYHDAIESVLRQRESAGTGVETIAISIHSMTPCLTAAGSPPRPWQIALSSYLDRRLTDPVLAALRRPGDVIVGDNEPYDLDPAVDYSTPFHALSRGLRHLQVEFRQDELPDAAAQRRWAERFAQAL